MFLQIEGLLKAADFRLINKIYAEPDWFEDGRRTAGRRARGVKKNQQARPEGLVKTVLQLVEKRLMANDLFLAAARPKTIIRTLLSRYGVGMEYGWHVDDALIAAQRTDLSFTLFLAPPDSYEGGELVIGEAAGERAVKLAAGDLVLYPSGSLHRVAPVTAGERRAAVGWVRSLIRDPAAREVLFDLAVLRHHALARQDRDTLDRLDKIVGSLLRRWADD